MINNATGHTAEPALEVRNLSKKYAATLAVDELSFAVNYGEIFGLLGPNGAGKTTTIRMVLDIIRPTAGEISILGGPMREATKARIGYLPEERGLYEEMTLLDTLLFLGQLKGLSRGVARTRAEEYLRTVELWEARDRKVKALSRGMNQKAQFVAAILHEPDLIIIDEPFSGLDPVNTRILKRLIYSLRERGAAIIMSSHQMHQVEEMCQRILLIDRGQRVLYGPLADIREQFIDNALEIDVELDKPSRLERIPGVTRVIRPQDHALLSTEKLSGNGNKNGRYRLLLADNAQPDRVLAARGGNAGH